ncbi:TlpA disulfide reductase family protein [Clostridium thermarum]|uniref:TlpA disulfide reductase family protein n=1 Tax=Clostridium thermarum TaxID=1716543 RepID=UPI00112112BB|nr:TlpA disulfide reductase family protein [Clostridium thermarum]
MKKIIPFAVLVFILFGSAYYIVSNNNLLPNNLSTEENKDSVNDDVNSKVASNEDTKEEEVKVKAPDFTLTDTQGNKVTLSDLKGKKVYLNFWATWCPPCRKEMPDIEKLYQETKDSDLVILAVNLGEDKDTVTAFADKNNYNFRILLDSAETVAIDYQIRSIPTSYFIDEEGYVRAGKIGLMTLEEMKQYVELLNK